MPTVKEYPIHFREMLKERGIPEKWVKQVLANPDIIENKDDGTTHYIKRIKEYDDRWLRVIINEDKIPAKIVTAFFDRRLRRKDHENQG